MIPLSDSCRGRFDPLRLRRIRRRLTLMSYFCSRATTIDEMILWRAAQGFIGGGMIPTVFRHRLHDLPAQQAADRRVRSSAWWRRWRRRSARRSAAVPDRQFLLALAVPGQHHSGVIVTGAPGC